MNTSGVLLELMSYVIPSLQLTATVLLTLLPDRNLVAKVTGCALLMVAHVVLIVFGWVGDFGGFRFVQVLMPPTAGAGLIVQVRRMRRQRRADDPTTTTVSKPTPGAEPEPG